MHFFYHDQTHGDWENDMFPATPVRQRASRRPLVLFLCTLAALAVLTVAAVLLGPTPVELAALPVGSRPPVPPTMTTAPTPPPTTIAQAPLGDGTTLAVAAGPEGDPHSLQDIYVENIGSIVGIRGTREGSMSLGTGVVMSTDGYIITNSHVIEGCSAVSVVLGDDTVYEALLAGQDEETDLAVLKILAEELTPARFGNSDLLQVGDTALAIGNPLGEDLRGTMTSGIISAINRDVQVEGRTMTLIQTTAALNSGNSGGALINEYGQVVGITNLKMHSYNDTVEGLGFAIPTTTVKTVVDALIDQGHVGGRPSIGIVAYTMTEAMAESYGSPPGVCIQSVEERSDAHRQGLLPGDVILEINGQPTLTMEDVAAIKEPLRTGDVLRMTIWRGGETIRADVTLVEQYTLTQ